MADEIAHNGAIEWVDKAQGDLTVARLIHEHNGPADLGCYHCQQAVEKLLKACLVAAGKRPPRAHDLPSLYHTAVQLHPSMKIDEDTLDRLTDYAVAPRYPGFDASQSESDLEPFIDFCDRLLPNIRELLETQPCENR